MDLHPEKAIEVYNDHTLLKLRYTKIKVASESLILALEGLKRVYPNKMMLVNRVDAAVKSFRDEFPKDKK